MSSVICFKLDQSKILLSGNRLFNFKEYQVDETVMSLNIFFFLLGWEKHIVGIGENAVYPFSPFSKVFSKAFFLKIINNSGLVKKC